MPSPCCVCLKATKKGTWLSTFPLQNEALLDKWLQALQQCIDKPINENSRICEKHFMKHDFLINPLSGRKRLKSHAVPSQNLQKIQKENHPILVIKPCRKRAFQLATNIETVPTVFEGHCNQQLPTAKQIPLNDIQHPCIQVQAAVCQKENHTLLHFGGPPKKKRKVNHKNSLQENNVNAVETNIARKRKEIITRKSCETASPTKSRSNNKSPTKKQKVTHCKSLPQKQKSPPIQEQTSSNSITELDNETAMSPSKKSNSKSPTKKQKVTHCKSSPQKQKSPPIQEQTSSNSITELDNETAMSPTKKSNSKSPTKKQKVTHCKSSPQKQKSPPIQEQTSSNSITELDNETAMSPSKKSNSKSPTKKQKVTHCKSSPQKQKSPPIQEQTSSNSITELDNETAMSPTKKSNSKSPTKKQKVTHCKSSPQKQKSPPIQEQTSSNSITELDNETTMSPTKNSNSKSPTKKQKVTHCKSSPQKQKSTFTSKAQAPYFNNNNTDEELESLLTFISTQENEDKSLNNNIPNKKSETCTTADKENNTNTVTSKISVNNLREKIKYMHQKKLQCDILKKKMNNNFQSSIFKKNKTYSSSYMKHVLQINLSLKCKLKETKEESMCYKNILKKVFNDDQQNYLLTGDSKGVEWSAETMSDALQIRFSCGTTGYNHLLKKGLPYPSVRTLQRRVEHIKFRPGILLDVFEMMKNKVEAMEDQDLDCNLVIDEVSIRSGLHYDESTKEIIGKVTIPEHDQEATASKAVVFLLAGIRQRWKQVVAYHYTPAAVNGNCLKKIVIDIVEIAESIGLKVHNVTSDMDGSNQRLWSAFGIVCGKYSVTNFKVPHPVDKNRFLSFMPDPVHVYKNIRHSLESNKIIEISKETQEKYNLPSNVIKYDHFQKLLDVEIENDLKMAPDFEAQSLNPNTWQKMRVSTTHKMLHHDAGSGLEVYGEINNDPEFLTTAWFAKTIYKWFQLVTARDTIHAFGKKNETKYKESIQFLNDVIVIFETIKIGEKGHWKPIQTGVILSTKTLLYHIHYFIEIKHYEFVLCGHFTQCCLENIFSVVRSRHPCPNALQFKQDLKLLSVSQYMKTVSNSNYADSKTTCLLDFLSVQQYKRNLPKQRNETEIFTKFIDVNLNDIKLNIYEQNALYYIGGVVTKQIINNDIKSQNTRVQFSNICSNCWENFISPEPVYEEYTLLTRRKEFSEKTSLQYLTPHAYQFLVVLEKIFKTCKNEVKNRENMEKLLLNTYKAHPDVHDFNFATCHHIKEIFMHRYFQWRLHSLNKKSNNYSIVMAQAAVPKSNPSKTMAADGYTRKS